MEQDSLAKCNNQDVCYKIIHLISGHRLADRENLFKKPEKNREQQRGINRFCPELFSDKYKSDDKQNHI